MPPPAPSDVVLRHLAHYLGPFTAKMALKTFAQSSVGKAPEALTIADMPKLLAALKPMMRTLIGARESDAVVQKVNQELGL